MIVEMSYKLCVFILLFFAVLKPSYGQEKLSKEELIQRAKDGRYPEAYNGFITNYKKFPKDPDYIYYTGVCLVQLNVQITEAIRLLKEATSSKSFQDSWFYLGKAYLLNYEFERAEEAFNKFSSVASRDEKERHQVTAYLNMCRNGRDICSRARKLSTAKIDTVDEESLLSFLNKQKIGGTLQKTDDFGKSSSPKRDGLRFAGNRFTLETKKTFGKRHRDIFIAEADDPVSKYKNIGSIVNTPFDEEFIFCDETALAVYFSSQGHNSAGGYDIFKSYYDKTSQKWSAPVNMGFPINSTGDEIAYVTIPGTDRSLLASRRNASPGKIIVYTLEKAEVVSEETILPMDAPEFAKLKPGNTVVNSKKPVPDKRHTISKTAVPVEIKDETYQKLIHEALILQIRSDSIRRMSDEKKEKLISAKSEADKTRIWQEIKTLDSKATEVQQKADVIYKRARTMESEKQELTRQQTQELARKAFSANNSASTRSEEKSAREKPPVITDDEEKHDILYRIQVGVFSKPQPEGLFKGFTNLYREELKNGNAIKYYVGLYKKIGEAEKGLIRVRDAGFKDAYIIGFYNGKIVPLGRARELELSLQK